MIKSLLGNFNRGNYRAQQVKAGNATVVQISTDLYQTSGGQTAISVQITSIEDGIAVNIGRQAWFGVAASLGQTVFSALRNPLNLLHRLDDVAQDIESLQLTDLIWKVIDQTAVTKQATQELSEKLRRTVCEYCDSANEVGAAACVACGAPLGNVQPGTCPHCGFVVRKTDHRCPNCGISFAE